MSTETVKPNPERLARVRLIIAGTRGEYDRKMFYRTVSSFLKNLMQEQGLTRSDIEIFSGMASSGADFYAVTFAEAHKIKLREFWAKWDVLDAPGAKIRTNSRGKKYNANAGFDRNIEMARQATHLIAFWDGRSPGTEHMIQTAKQFGLVHAIIHINTPRKVLTCPND